MNKLLYIIFTCSFVYNEIGAIWFDNSIEITLPQGKVKGTRSTVKNYKKFLGIPYASVKHRFAEPGEPPSWNGTFIANRGTIKCMQYFATLGLPVGQEDCLVLNIFTPIRQEAKPFSVIVFIHGGGFYWGSNSHYIYNPRFLVKKNVVVVTVNYRLGAFGFLCLNHNEAPGNVGLKDQVAALKWIQKNIEYFGGDPKSVTLFGESVGAIAVNYLLLAEPAKGLFHKAIMNSGSILSTLAFDSHPIESAVKIASRLGSNTTDPEELLKVFKDATPEEIVKASYFDQSNDIFAPYVFKPCIEKTNKQKLIIDGPAELLNKANVNIPIIMGFNDKEGINYAGNYDAVRLKNLNSDLTSIIPNNLFFNSNKDKQMFIAKVKAFYFGNASITMNGLIDYFSDTVIIYPIVATTESLLRKSNRSIYNYYFTYDSIRNLYKLISRLPNVPGANHADELFYIFDPIVYQVLPNIPKDVEMIELLTNLWTNFAKTKIPTGTKITWKPNQKHDQFLELGSKVNMISLPNNQRMEFWRKAYEQYGIKM